MIAPSKSNALRNKSIAYRLFSSKSNENRRYFGIKCDEIAKFVKVEDA